MTTPRKRQRRQIVKTCARPLCGRTFRPWKKEQDCCSRSCARKFSPVFLAHIRGLSKKGGQAAGAKKRRQAIERHEAMVQGLTPVEALRKGLRVGYQAGLHATARAASARGYQQALDDMAAVGGAQ